MAEEISVSGNGSDSTSTANISFNNNTAVSQDNTANITNNVDINADTGNNTADNNTNGDVSITTGDIDITSNIENNGINQNSVQTGCCQGGVDIGISGNGSDSDNTVNFTQNNNTNIDVNNNANVTNNVNGKANTGYNSANNNTNGNVSISTGSIKVSDTIKNNSINVYDIHASSGSVGDTSILIADNGSNSDNSITFTDEQNVVIEVDNSAVIENNSAWDLNTGHNDASGNTGGDVSITTGDILLTSTIDNSKINVGLVDVDCCKPDQGGNNPPPDVTPPPPTITPTQPCVSNCNPSNDNPSQGSTPGEVLPVTGASSSLLLLAIANILMLFLGWYLRLRSGRSPNFAYAR
ncbi:MAG: hypothetical protein ACD_22C00093G0001 [uncultured bacterium]|nr:MAG: hypothetical protein ACD_22C00093G0001 [uncultured bacterium]